MLELPHLRQPSGQQLRLASNALAADATGVWVFDHGARNLVSGEPTVLSGTAYYGVGPRGRVARTNLGANRVQLASNSVNLLGSGSSGFTVALHYRKIGAAAACAGFGLDASAIATQRAGTHFPFSDGTLYWDFGGNSAGTSRLTAASLTYGDDFWVFTTGTRGMEIWQNGIRRAQQGSSVSWNSVTNPYYLGMHGTATQADDAECALFVCAPRQWSPGEIVGWFREPFQVVKRGLVYVRAGGTPTLAVADATHAHAADALTLTQLHVLTVADASHAHLADALTLTQTHILTLADALHAHTTDNVVLTVDGTLVVNDALHAHTTDNVALTQTHILAVADALHSQLADNVTLAVGGTTLAIADALHAHAADNLALTQLHILVVSAALHAHLADTLTLALPGAAILHDRVLFVRGENRTLVIVADTRALEIPGDNRTLTVH